MVQSLLRNIVICLVISGVLLAGCSMPIEARAGAVQITSSPSGAEVYLDNEYHGTTPAIITAVPSGSHLLEIREEGYDRWSVPVTVIAGSTANITAPLVPVIATIPVTFVTATPAIKDDLPQIHIDGYWMHPAVRSDTNPAPLLIHIDGFNVGSANAREVTVSANLYYQGHMICWNTIYLGTLTAGGHVVKDTMVSCTLPSNLNDPDLTVKFENVVVTQ